MDMRLNDLAQQCLHAAETNTMNFPQIVGTLMEGGFEGYAVDFRRGTATYYLPNGDSTELKASHVGISVAEEFDPSKLEAAVREAQMQVPGYTYRVFCEKVMAAGCAGYMVSFLGRRVVYFGRTAEIHVEHFPRQ